MHGPTRTDALDADRSVPALMVKVGRYPVHHGGLGVMRSLGRLGVPVYALSERRYTPAMFSRYLTGRFEWSATGDEDPGELVAGLVEVGGRLGRRAVAIAGDDEAAVLLAEHAGVLREHFLLPAVAPTLPRELASKRGLYEHCRAYGIPTPVVALPRDVDDLVDRARELTYPVVVKKIDAYRRLRTPHLANTSIVEDERQLIERFGAPEQVDGLLVQQYIPHEHAEDWFVHFYADAGSSCPIAVAGRKLRSWPPGTGSTACGRTEENPALVDLVARLCKETGYQGIADLDLRYDRRDGQYKLVDFNPRIGAQFMVARNEAGVDVVRAMHLDLTGRAVPRAPQRAYRFVVETFDYPARIAYWRHPARFATPAPRATRVRVPTLWGWWARDDPRPFALMAVRAAYGRVAALARAALRAALRPLRSALGPRGAAPRPAAVSDPDSSTDR